MSAHLLTFQDLVAHVQDVADVQGDGVDFRRAMRAAQWGFEQATQRHQWSNYDTEHVITFQAPESTGTVDINASGVVTRSGQVWPSWAEYGSLVIDDNLYRVSTRDSDTQLTLEAWTGVAVTGQTYQLAHNRAILPHFVRDAFDAWDQTADIRLIPIDPAQFRERDRWQLGSAGRPAYTTIRRVSINGVVRSELRITPFPSLLTTINVTYIRTPNLPRVLYPTQRLSTADDGTVTLTTPLPPTLDVVGSWLRISTNEANPTPDLSSNLFINADAEWEGVITAQASTTSLSVSADVPVVSNRGGFITDVLDIPEFALRAAKLYAEAQMARLQGSDLNKYQTLERLADQELRYAMEQDGQLSRNRGRLYHRGEVIAPIPYVDP